RGFDLGAVLLQDGVQELQRDHAQDEYREQHFLGAALRQYLFEPCPQETLDGGVESGEQQASQQHRRRYPGLRNDGAREHRAHPDDGGYGRGIRQAVNQSEHVESGKAQGKAQERPEGKLRRKAGEQDRKQLPPNQQTQKNQPQIGLLMSSKEVFGAG